MWEDADWEDLDRPNWRGLGVADPIKNVEVSTDRIALL